MKRSLLIIPILALALSGCNGISLGNEVEVTETTEVPVPDTVADTYLTLTYDEVTVSYSLTDNQAFGIPDINYLTVYADSTSFDNCTIEVKYMPNYKRFEPLLDKSVHLAPINHGYVAVVTDFGIGSDTCDKIVNSVELTSYIPNSDEVQ